MSAEQQMERRISGIPLVAPERMRAVEVPNPEVDELPGELLVRVAAQEQQWMLVVESYGNVGDAGAFVRFRAATGDVTEVPVGQAMDVLLVEEPWTS